MRCPMRNWSPLPKCYNAWLVELQRRYCSAVASPDAMLSLSKTVLRTSDLSGLVAGLLPPNDGSLSKDEFSNVRSAVLESSIRKRPVDSSLLWYFTEKREFERGLSYIRHLNADGLLNPASLKVAVYFLITCFINRRDIPTSDVAKILVDSLSLWQKKFPDMFHLHLLFALGCLGEWNEIRSLWPYLDQSTKAESANLLLVSSCRHHKLERFWAMCQSDCRRFSVEDSGLKELASYLSSSLPDETFALDNFDKFERFMRNSKELLVDEDTAMSMKKFFESFEHRKWSVKEGTIDAQGRCAVCERELDRVCIPDSDFAEMKKEVFEKVLIGENVYRQTTPKELSRFRKLLAAEGPFDVVIDGCNVAFFGRQTSDVKLLLTRILNTVCSLKEKHNFKKPLVIGRNHFLRCDDLMAQLSKVARCFLATNVSTDDAFVITAALNGGSQTYFVTNDLLGGHSHRLSENSQFTFSQWQRMRQIMLTRTRSAKHFICHLPNDVYAGPQKYECGYHIPYSRKEEVGWTRAKERMEVLSSGRPSVKHLLCIQRL